MKRCLKTADHQPDFREEASGRKTRIDGGRQCGMIHPLCGNGMAMAIHSAKILLGIAG
jgi:hypothetical protein